MSESVIAAKAKRFVELSMNTYTSHSERAALRCSAGDASGLCDVISRWIGEQHRKKGGGITARGRELQAIAKLCGDEIWKMREMIR